MTMKMQKAGMALLLGMLAPAAGAIEIDGIVAKVGSESILKSDVINEMRRYGQVDPSRFAEVRNELIDRKLILKSASQSKFTMQEWVVENRVREIVNRAFDGDRNRLMDMLSQQKVSYSEWYQRVKEDLIVGAMRWNVVDKNVTASPAAIRREYAEHRSRYVEQHLVSVSVITLSPENAARRDEIAAQLKEKSFEALGAKVYANVQPEDNFQPEIVSEIEKMPKGTISHWIELDGWSFLIRKDDETQGRQLTFEEAYDQIEANVKEARAKQLYLEWLERLRAESYIRVY